MKKLLFLFLLGVCGSVWSQSKVESVPVIGVRLTLGEPYTEEGVTLIFSEVTEDSRCPTNVTCVWAGKAEVKLSVTAGEGDTVIKTLTFDSATNRQEWPNMVYETADFRIYVPALKPYPENAGESLDYYLVVVCELKGQ